VTFRRIVKSLAISGVLAVGAFLASLWLERRTETALPAPTGPFAVSRAIYDWTDPATPDKLAPVPGTKRELLVWIWYPSTTGPSAAPDDYLPVPMRATSGPSGLFKLVTRDISKVHGHSTRNGDIAPQQPSYPVLIMRAGASAEVLSYSTLPKIYCLHSFFDACLKGANTERLNLASPLYPEIQVRP